MKWVAALLLILNVGIFLGVSDRQVATGAAPENESPDVNPDSMLLIKEVLPKLETQPEATAIIPKPIPEPNIDPVNEPIDIEDIETIQTAVIAPTINWTCYRVGPFKDRSNWRTTQQWAQDQNFIFKPIRSESRELRAVRVFMGPYESSNLAQVDVKQLENKDLEHFVYRQEDGEFRISLGYFTQEELATKFVDYLVQQNIQAKSHPEYRTLGPFDWMDIKVSGENRSSLVARDWGAETIQLIEKSCETL